MNVDLLVQQVGLRFRTFGGGRGDDGKGSLNPLVVVLKDHPMMFAAGVDVKEVVTFVAHMVRRFPKTTPDEI